MISSAPPQALSGFLPTLRRNPGLSDLSIDLPGVAAKMGNRDRGARQRVEDFPLDDTKPEADTGWVWALVRSSGDPPQQVWVRYVAGTAPEGLATRPASMPKERDEGVAIVEARRPVGLRETTSSADPDLLTVAEFAELAGIARSSVYELIRKGLPSFRSPHVGRRIRRAQALAWLAEGGATRSRAAKRIAKSERHHGR